MPMSDPQLDAHSSITIDELITLTFQDYRTLHERTLKTLQTMAQNLRGDELWPTDVAGPIFMVQRSYNERRSQLDEQWGRLLVQRRDVIQAHIARGEAAEDWAKQLELTEHLIGHELPELLELEIPPLRRDQTVSTAQIREFYTTVIMRLEKILQAIERIGEIWWPLDEPQSMISEREYPSSELPTEAPAPIDFELSGGSHFYDDEPYRPEPTPLPSPPIIAPAEPTKTKKPDFEPPKPSESGEQSPPIRRRQEMVDKPTQQPSPEPPPPQEEAEHIPVDLDELDDEIAFGGKPDQPMPPPPPPIIAPAEPATTEYAPPRPTPAGPTADPERKVTDGRLAQANIEPTHFTAYAPKEVPPAQWVNLAAYIFRESAGGAVEKDAQQKFGAELAEMRHGKAAAVREIEEGATITATPRLEGFTFNPESLSLKFVKPYHRFDFEMMAGQERLNLASNGAITFSMGGVIVGEIPLSVFVGERATIEVGMIQADPYQKIFCSYSHRDTKVVERVERAYRVLGFDYLRDATRLRSGQQWNAELMRWIDEAHIFQLFWSAAAAQSPYVEQEWRHALHITRPNFIRPVYWKKPLVAPPSELEKLHFAYDPQIQGAGWWNRLAGLVRG